MLGGYKNNLDAIIIFKKLTQKHNQNVLTKIYFTNKFNLHNCSYLNALSSIIFGLLFQYFCVYKLYMKTKK